MTESEFNASGAIEETTTAAGAEGGASEPATQPTSLIQFLPLLTSLQSVQKYVSTVPTYVPQTFQEQIQFVYDGTHYFLYLYFNNQWNSFSVSPGAGSAISTLSGTDSFSGTSPVSTTHTITHGFGKRPTTITLNIPTLVAPSPSGSGHTGEEPQGWFTLDTNGNPIAGMYISYSHVFGGSGVFTLTQAGRLTNSITASGSASGGTSTVTITLNNVTDTTFDLVYTSAGTAFVGPFTSPTLTWTVMG